MILQDPGPLPPGKPQPDLPPTGPDLPFPEPTDPDVRPDPVPGPDPERIPPQDPDRTPPGEITPPIRGQGGDAA